MKRTTLLLVLLGLFSACFGQPVIGLKEVPQAVDVYDKYEVTFTLGNYSNPYDPKVIDVYAVFTAPDGREFRVNGFYFEGYSFSEKKGVEVAERLRDGAKWKVRFTPDISGKWTYVIHAVDRKGSTSTATLAFECLSKAYAEGFVRVANTHYLKREVVDNGEHGYRSFFPVGPNVAWYRSADYNKFKKPYGIYEYISYIDALSGNANYMRVWSCRYQYLSLYGPEHAIRENDRPTMYFDSKLNQKDAAELDFIVDYAAQHGINLMLCMFTFGDFRDDSEGLEKSGTYGSMPSGWRYNPYHTILGLEHPAEFFSDPKAMRVTRNLIRYYVARWGYATNIVSWELFNEVSNIFRNTTLQGDEMGFVEDWHRELTVMIHSIDPHRHLVTTSLGSATGMEDLERSIFNDLDIVQDHFYQNIQKAKMKEQVSRILLNKANEMRLYYPLKPNFMGEYGSTSKVSGISSQTKDPKGVELHNTLWSSLFSGSMGAASFWFWKDLSKCDLFDRFKPVTVFSNSLPILSGTFKAATTGFIKDNTVVFPNNIATYYLVNAAEDTLIGWCQDEAYCYISLRRLTDEVGNNQHFVNDGVFDPDGYVYTLIPEKRPAPSHKSNQIMFSIDNQPNGTEYVVRWFDTETGLELTSEATTAVVRRSFFRGKRLFIEIPQSIVNNKEGRVNNTFGDAVFMVCKASR